MWGIHRKLFPFEAKVPFYIALEKKSSLADSVVVIGYGTSSKAKLTTSVSTINKEQINDLAISNIADAFTGHVSGVLVENGAGGQVMHRSSEFEVTGQLMQAVNRYTWLMEW